MTDKILLILSTLDTDDDRIAIKKTLRGRDVEVTCESRRGEGRAIEEAFRYAESTSKRVVALQVLSSHLYHWGRCDSILSGPGKARFLIYVRDEVLRRSREKAEILHQSAQERGIAIEIRSVESEDPGSAIIEEAEKGYESIFLPKQRKGLFPLFEKTLTQHLHKRVSSRIIEC